MAWRLTVRVGPRVQRSTHPSLDAALDALEERASQLVADVGRAPVDVRYRRFEPADQVAARLELSGPQRLMPSVRAGLDVHGDGSSEAYVGRVRREAVKMRRRETAIDALRRTLSARER
jgi:hypothetical protein